MLILTLWIARVDKIDLNYSVRRSFWLLMLRNILMVGWIFVGTISLYYLSLAVIYSINICGSLLVFIWDAYLYGIRINKNQKIGVALGLFGALLVINGNYIISLLDEGFTIETDFEYFRSKEIIQTVIGAAILFVANIGASFSFSVTKSVKIHKNGS